MSGVGKDLWDRGKDGGRREQRSFLRYAIVATALFAVFMFVKKDNVFTWINAGFTLRAQRRQIEQLERRNEGLDRQISNLSANRDSLERYARETYFFAAPGDDVYIDGTGRR